MIEEILIVNRNKIFHETSKLTMNLAISIMNYAIFPFINESTIWIYLYFQLRNFKFFASPFIFDIIYYKFELGSASKKDFGASSIGVIIPIS